MPRPLLVPTWCVAIAALMVGGCSFDQGGIGFDDLDGVDGGGATSDASAGDASPNSPDADPDQITEDIVHLPPSAEIAGEAGLRLGDSTIDTTTLTIDGAQPPAGVTFDVVAQSPAGAELAVLHVRGLEVMALTQVTVIGSRPLVIVASRAVIVEGTLFAGASLAVPGPGGALPGAGPGKGNDGEHTGSYRDSGGGGGGFGSQGARGGNVSCIISCSEAAGGPGGPAYGTPMLAELQGGSSGGEAVSCDSDEGGAGGGALQIYSAVSVTIGAAGAISVGGGGGGHGNACADNWGAAAGGGSGGAIFLQAPTVTNSGALLSHGGGGGGGSGGGGDGEPGRNANFRDNAAPGGDGSGSLGANGGDGATGAAPAQAGDDVGNNGNGGGGGGGNGRIVVIVSSGTFTDNVSSPLAQSGTY